MTDIQEESLARMRRSLDLEFVRMEDDFDETRDARKKIAEKLVTAALAVNILVNEGGVNDDTDTALRVNVAALKALDNIEKANMNAITMKLRRSEQEAMSAAANNDRIMVVLKATEPGRIDSQKFDPDLLEDKLAEMFDSQILDTEMKTNPQDLDDN